MYSMCVVVPCVCVYEWKLKRRQEKVSVILLFFAFKNTGITKVISHLSMNDSLSSDIYAHTHKHTLLHSSDSQCNSEGEAEEHST